jgi:hypothetical protein
MEYMDQAPRGQELKPALSVEVLGFDLWDWEKDGKQTGPLFGWAVGAGVVANLSDRDGDANWGWGGVVHLDRSYNVGVVFYDGDPAFFVSANVGKKLLKATKLYGKYVK